MKKITLTLAALLGITSFISAQDLYVSPSSYVFVQDEVVFVNDDLRLEATDSNIYLRDGAQLVQNTDTKNSDIGELSVYQLQTSSGGLSTGVYEYNYWNSPVGVADASMNTNVNFDISNLHKPTNPALSSDVTTATYGTTNDYQSTATEIAKYWLWQMQSGGGYAQWSHVSDIGNVASGYGFTMKGSPTANNTLDFRGRPNTGDMDIDCTFSGTDMDTNSGLSDQVETLTGNPYPSTMDLKRFLMHPTNKVVLDGSIYFWEQNAIGSHNLTEYDGGYAVYTPGAVVPDADYNNPAHPNWAIDGTYAVATFANYNGSGDNIGASGSGPSSDYTANHARRYAAIGQGFMVRSFDNGGAAAGGTAKIENSMRLYVKNIPGGNTDVFAKNTQNAEVSIGNSNKVIAMSHNGIDYQTIINNPTATPEIRIHTKINNTYYRENVLAFRNNTDLSYNKFCDGKNPMVLKSDTYFIADSKKLVIKSIAYDIDTRLPFGLNADNTNNTYSITINSLNNISSNIEVFVYDKEADTHTDIRNGAFEISLPQGEYDNRFEIVFKDASKEANEELLVEETEVINSFDVFQNNTNNQLTIKNPKSHIVKSFTMYDVTGKLIYNKHNLGNETEYTFPTNTLSAGTYVTKVVTDQNFEISKKVIVHN